jgi:PAS domain S-box-containing protein
MDSLANAPSLLNYLDAPVVVADPDGRVVFLNPAFEVSFATTRDRCEGRALAELFEGGDREAVLAAVAATCQRGQSVRFRIRHRDCGFQVLASPIAVDGQRVGSVLLLTEDPLETEGLHRAQRELFRAVDQLTDAIDHLARRDAELSEGEREDWVASGRGAVADCRRAAGNLGRMADGQVRQRSREAMIDPSRVVRDAVAGLAYEMAEGEVSLDVLLAPDLPLVRGDGKRLQEALEALLRSRVARSPSWLALGARRDEAAGEVFVSISLTEPGPAGGPPAPPVVTEIVAGLGGRIDVEALDGGDRATRIRLRAV